MNRLNLLTPSNAWNVSWLSSASYTNVSIVSVMTIISLVNAFTVSASSFYTFSIPFYCYFNRTLKN